MQNQVIRGSKTKADAIKHVNDAITANDECFQLFRRFLIKEPSRDPYEGSYILLGHNSFSNDIDDANIIAALAEGRNEELRAGLRTLDEGQLADRRSILFFENTT